MQISDSQTLTDEQTGTLWTRYGAYLIEEHAELNAFTRPWAFWCFDAPEPRRRINGVHPFENPERKEAITAALEKWPGHVLYTSANELTHGKPAHLIVDDDVSAKYETEREYLTRLNLLTDHERSLDASE